MGADNTRVMSEFPGSVPEYRYDKKIILNPDRIRHFSNVQLYLTIYFKIFFIYSQKNI